MFSKRPGAAVNLKVDEFEAGNWMTNGEFVCGSKEHKTGDQGVAKLVMTAEMAKMVTSYQAVISLGRCCPRKRYSGVFFMKTIGVSQLTATTMTTSSLNTPGTVSFNN